MEEDVFIGCTIDELIFMRNWELIDSKENVMVFKIQGFHFLWSIKYYYFEFQQGKVTNIKSSKYKIKKIIF